MDTKSDRVNPIERVAYAFVGLSSGDAMLLLYLLALRARASLVAVHTEALITFAVTFFGFCAVSFVGWLFVGFPIALFLPARSITRLSWPIALVMGGVLGPVALLGVMLTVHVGTTGSVSAMALAIISGVSPYAYSILISSVSSGVYVALLRKQTRSRHITVTALDPGPSREQDGKARVESTVYMRKPLVRYLGEVFVAFVVVAFVAGFGLILGFITFYVTGLRILLPMFAGPTYLFFILVGSGLGYIVNRRQCSRVAPWVWILPTIWSAHFAAVDLSSGIHNQDSVLGYIWNTLILGNHEMALISQWMIAVPVITSLAYSFGAWLAIRHSAPPLIA